MRELLTAGGVVKDSHSLEDVKKTLKLASLIDCQSYRESSQLIRQRAISSGLFRCLETCFLKDSPAIIVSSRTVDI